MGNALNPSTSCAIEDFRGEFKKDQGDLSKPERSKVEIQEVGKEMPLGFIGKSEVHQGGL